MVVISTLGNGLGKMITDLSLKLYFYDSITWELPFDISIISECYITLEAL